MLLRSTRNKHAYPGTSDGLPPPRGAAPPRRARELHLKNIAQKFLFNKPIISKIFKTISVVPIVVNPPKNVNKSYYS